MVHCETRARMLASCSDRAETMPSSLARLAIFQATQCWRGRFLRLAHSFDFAKPGAELGQIRSPQADPEVPLGTRVTLRFPTRSPLQRRTVGLCQVRKCPPAL